MYNIEDKFFYEILDDYKNNENKDEIFEMFCMLIWESSNERTVFTNYVSFKTNDCKNDLYKELFDKYNNIPYTDYVRVCEATDFVSLLRQKLNNIYSQYCDKRIYLKKNYMELLKYSKNMYFQLFRDNNEMILLDIDRLDIDLSQTLNDAANVKEKFTKGKVLIGWNKYIGLMNGFMRRCFDNYVPLNQSEEKNEFVLDVDLWTEDNYCIKYFCKSLDRYFRNYEKEYFGVRQKKKYKECVSCGGLIEIDNIKDVCKICTEKRRVSVKYIKCCDCGVEFEVDGNVKNKKRCDVCYKIYRKKCVRENVKNYRNKM